MFRIRSLFLFAVVAMLAAPLAHAASGSATAKSSTKRTHAASSQTTPTTPAASAPAKTASGAKAAAAPLIDLNKASREELMKLPGIGDVIAGKIIAARPFKSKRELLTKKLVSAREYGVISASVIAKQEPAAASKPH